MILGIGSDIVNIARVEKGIARFGERFEKRLFTAQERALAARRGERAGAKAKAATLAKRLAAKEAFVKALGTGVAGGIRWQDVEVVSQPGGKATLTASGMALTRLRALSPRGMMPKIELSLSDDYPFALAFVVISFD